MTKIEYINIDLANNGVKLEKFILNKFNIYNYIYLQKLIRTGQIKINKKRIKLGYILKQGDVLRLPIIVKSRIVNLSECVKSKPCNKLSSKEIFFIDYLLKNILYQDEHILAINKPKGLSVQGGKSVYTNLDKLLPHIKKKIDTIYNSDLKIVHRLDQNTSGILLLAKTNAAAKILSTQFKEQKIKKIYYCLVQGELNEDGKINAPLLKVNNHNNKMAIDIHGKSAITEYKVIGTTTEKFLEKNNTQNNFSITLLKVLPKTGRKHQIRVHLGVLLNKPIIGDFKYGYKLLELPFKLNKDEVFLHAYSITFYNLENKKIEIIAPLDEKWTSSLKKLDLYKYIN